MHELLAFTAMEVTDRRRDRGIVHHDDHFDDPIPLNKRLIEKTEEIDGSAITTWYESSSEVTARELGTARDVLMFLPSHTTPLANARSVLDHHESDRWKCKVASDECGVPEKLSTI